MVYHNYYVCWIFIFVYFSYFLSSYSQICAAIGLCTKVTDNIALDETSTTGLPCELCEYAVTKLDQILEDKTDEQKIKNALDSLCTYLPSSIGGECKNFVDTYTDLIIEMLTNDVTPKEVTYHFLSRYSNMKYAIFCKQNSNV